MYTFSARLSVFLFALLSLAPLGCGDSHSSADSGQNGTTTKPVAKDPCKEADRQTMPIYGRYWKDDSPTTKKTDYQQGTPDASTLSGVAGKKVTFFGDKKTLLETQTCSDGWFGFDQVKSNIGVINYGSEECSTANCPTQLAKGASEKSTVTIVTLGDSIPVITATVGAKKFPQKLKELAQPVVDIEDINVAVSGSKTVDWLPSKANFIDKIVPHKEEADIYVLSVGGNDFLELFRESIARIDLKGDPAQIGIQFVNELTRIKQGLTHARENLKMIISKLREISPQADIVWISYFNYGRGSELMKKVPKVVQPQLQGFITQQLDLFINELSGYEKTMVLDMFGKMDKGAEKLDFSQYLTDAIHLNDRGHELYAEELFKFLGGWRREDPEIGRVRYIGYPEP